MICLTSLLGRLHIFSRECPIWNSFGLFHGPHLFYCSSCINASRSIAKVFELAVGWRTASSLEKNCSYLLNSQTILICGFEHQGNGSSHMWSGHTRPAFCGQAIHFPVPYLRL